MHALQVLIPGTLKPDGTLELDVKPALPAGPVEVLIRAQPPSNGGADTWWEYLQYARAQMLAQDHAFRTKDQIDADRARLRQQDDARHEGLRPKE
jgi:hypothetical protein